MVNISCCESIVKDIAAGHMVILFDDQREEEGDFVIAADKITPEAIKLMLKYGSGIISLAITESKAEQLGLATLCPKNSSRESSPLFTPPIDARYDIGSGVSAVDRARTIAIAVHSSSGEGDIRVPGHIFPLIAARGGIKERQGHTESSIEIVARAGLNPAAVICEVLNENKEVADLEYIMEFSRIHGIKVGLIRDVLHSVKEVVL